MSVVAPSGTFGRDFLESWGGFPIFDSIQAAMAIPNLPGSMQQSKLDFVDVTRGLAILGVVIHHFISRTNLLHGLPASVDFVAQQGAHGVQLFFIASAFTLFRSYHHRSPLEQHPVRNFFVRRYFRIAPMYYVGIAYYLWQNGPGPIHYMGADFYNSPDNILANIFFLNEFNPYYLWLVPGSWSVATEILFYVLVPLLFRWVPNLKAALRFVGIALVIRIIFWNVFKNLPWIEDVHLRMLYANWVLPTQLVIFALGILLFFILRGDPWPKLGKWDLFFWAALVFAEVFSQGGRVFHAEVVLSIGFVAMIVGLSKLEWGHLPGKVLRHIGKVSFSLYLTHWGVIHWLDHYGHVQIQPGLGWAATAFEFTWRLCLVLAVGILVSTVTFQLVEKQGQELAKRLIGKDAKM